MVTGSREVGEAQFCISEADGVGVLLPAGKMKRFLWFGQPVEQALPKMGSLKKIGSRVDSYLDYRVERQRFD